MRIKWGDFLAWCMTYMGKHTTHEFARIHLEWMKYLEHPRVGLAAPRNFAKSTIFSVFYPLYRALEFPGSGITIVSATAALAERFLSKIRLEVEENDDIKADYGIQVGGKWCSDHLGFANGSEIEGKGAGRQLRGFRPDVVILDDAETDEGVLSEDRRKEFDSWVKKTVLGTLGNKGQLIMVGTILHPLSFLNGVVKGMFPSWKTGLYQALSTTDESLWESRWPTYDLLARREEIGELAFRQEFMNDPVPDDWRVFKPEQIHFYDSLPPELSYTTTIDPAVSLEAGADCTAITTVGTDDHGFMFVAELTRGRFQVQEVIDKLFYHFTRWKPHTIGIEEIGLQKLFRYAIDLECKKRGVYPHILGLKLDFAKGRKKRFRIEAMQPFFEQGKFFLHRDQQVLVDELLTYPTQKHDDCIDSLASHLEIIKPGKKKITNLIVDNSWADIWLSRQRRSQKRAVRWHMEADSAKVF